MSDQAGVPPMPLAKVSTQASVSVIPLKMPPKMVMGFLVLWEGEVGRVGERGGVRVGGSGVQGGVPRLPLALERIQTSRKGEPPASPPYVIKMLLTES